MVFDVQLGNGRIFLAVNLLLPQPLKGVGVVLSHGWGGGHAFDDLHSSSESGK